MTVTVELKQITQLPSDEVSQTPSRDITASTEVCFHWLRLYYFFACREINAVHLIHALSTEGVNYWV